MKDQATQVVAEEVAGKRASLMVFKVPRIYLISFLAVASWAVFLSVAWLFQNLFFQI